MISCSTSLRFKLIDEKLSMPGNQLTLAELCEFASVSKSGYYYWKSSRQSRQVREERDKADFSLILHIFQRRGYKKGARQIYQCHLNLMTLITS